MMAQYLTMPNIAIVVLVAVLLGALWYFGYRKAVEGIILSLVTEAEHKFGGGTGKLKYAWVTGAIYPRLPLVIRFFLTQEELDKLIEDGVIQLELLLTSGDNSPRPPSA